MFKNNVSLLFVNLTDSSINRLKISSILFDHNFKLANIQDWLAKFILNFTY